MRGQARRWGVQNQKQTASEQEDDPHAQAKLQGGNQPYPGGLQGRTVDEEIHNPLQQKAVFHATLPNQIQRGANVRQVEDQPHLISFLFITSILNYNAGNTTRW